MFTAVPLDLAEYGGQITERRAAQLHAQPVPQHGDSTGSASQG